MSSIDEKTTSNLIETLRNGEEGFRAAGEKLANGSSAELSREFISFSQQRAQFSAELAAVANSYGDHVEERSTIPGAMHRGWIAVKDALTGDSPEAVLKAALTGEDHAVSEYEDAMKTDLSEGLRTIVSRQLAAICATRDRVKLLAGQN